MDDSEKGFAISSEQIEGFISSRRLTKISARAYRGLLKAFRSYVGAGSDVPLSFMVEPFLLFSRQCRPKKDSTIRTQKSILNAFILWIEDCSRVTLFSSYDEEEDAAITPRSWHVLEPSELKTMLASRKLAIRDERTLRNRAILVVAITTGISLPEIAELNIGNLLCDGSRWWLQLANGNLQRIPPVAGKAIEDYLTTRPDPQPEEVLFEAYSPKGGRLNGPYIRKVVDDILKDYDLTYSKLFGRGSEYVVAIHIGHLDETQKAEIAREVLTLRFACLEL